MIQKTSIQQKVLKTTLTSLLIIALIGLTSSLAWGTQPQFNQSFYNFSFYEENDGTANYAYVGTVSANGSVGDTLTYSLEGHNQSMFRINSETGVITYIGPGEDYESANKLDHTFKAKVTNDNNENEVYVYVYVKDLNDNYPIFSQDIFYLYLDENANGSSNPVPIGNIIATDLDEGSLKYSITQGDINKFAINSTTGEVTYIGNGEDYESGIYQYNLKVQASDGTYHPKKDLIVIINDLENESRNYPNCSGTAALRGSTSKTDLIADCNTLLSFKKHIRAVNLNWDIYTRIGKWEGVTIKNNRVTKLYLRNKNLTGSIPKELGNLSGLVYLNMIFNNLTGEIPKELGKLSNSFELDLSYNNLNGEIPKELGNMASLIQLYLNHNNLTGSIPKELGNLHIYDLYLDHNNLTGEIPREFENLSLRSLRLSNNNLTGSIPSQIGDQNLKELFLNNNKLTGNIPTQIGSLTNLEDLYLNDNELTGSIPSQFGSLTKLENLYLNNNKLTRNIPTQIGSLTKLENLYMNNNELTGSIPSQIGSLTNLENLYMNNNNLTGNIPEELGSLIKLINLDLSYNNLTGSIPTQIGDLTNLINLFLNNNNLTGNIPEELGSLTKLINLDFSNNDLTGSIPTQIGDLTNLINLFLNNNNLNGSIPTQIGNLIDLVNLTINNNNLTGRIPRQMVSLWDLEKLFLNNNNLNGRIPSQLGNLRRLKYLHLNNNNLNEGIPIGFGYLEDLEEFFLNNNNLTGDIPYELARLGELSLFFLNNNNLTGEIPEEFGDLANLRILLMNNNNLNGSIPRELGNLSKLEVLDLSYNNLNGSIPEELENLPNLRSLNLSNNNLRSNPDNIEILPPQPNNNPVFNQNHYNFNLDENANGNPNPISIGTVNATDEDDDNLTYTITQGNTNKFNIHSGTGKITYTGNGEDYDSGTTQYTLTIQADDGQNNINAQVTISINNLNDNSPQFSRNSYTFSLDENADGNPNPVTIGTVTATDEDSNTLTYTITQGNTNKFDINSQTGKITYTGNGENYESGITQHTLTIRANDGQNNANAQVTININNLNDNSPQFGQSSYTFNLNENTDRNPNPVTIGTVTATDEDSNTLTYTIIQGNTNKFDINSQTGKITYIGTGEDYESGITQHTLTIRANDGQNNANAQVTININNLNDNSPQFGQSSYTFNLNENADGNPNPVTIGTVTATDEDSNTLTYTITSGNINKFDINSQTGKITYIGTGEDYESGTTQHTLTIRANDGQNNANAQVTININNLNDNFPAFTQNSYNFDIDENEDGNPNSVSLGTVNATDEDSNTLTYTITSGNINKFRINSETSEMSYIGTGEDYESGTTQYTLTVQANDGQNNANAQVTININNLNDNSPQFSQSFYTFSLNENADGNSNPVTIGTVTATDEDVGDTLRYSITSGNADNKYDINSTTGEITYIGSGEDGSTPMYSLNVSVTDTEFSDQTTVQIIINATSNNNNHPQFPTDVAYFDLDENLNGPIYVHELTATDDDVNDTITYSIASCDRSKFSINSSTGRAHYIGSGEDFESLVESGSTQFNCIIEASDGSLNDTIRLEINVVDVNEAPEFPGSGYASNDLDENIDGSSSNKFLHFTFATDPDDDNLTYSITEGDTSKFRVDESNGNLYYIGSGEDYEDLIDLGDNSYSVTITVSDGEHNDSYIFTLEILDVNDAPMFTGFETRGPMKAYFFNFDENLNGSSTPVFVGNVTATDDDEDNLTYSFTTAQTKFEINSSTGEITYIGSGENQEDEDSFRKAVQVSDGNLNVSVNVLISVNDVNEAPEFNQDSYNFILNENTNGSSTPFPIGTVTATDPEEDTLTYSILPGEIDKFQINSTTGEITYIGSGEDGSTSVYSLNVSVTDTEFSAQTTVQITINATVNTNNPPVFTELSHLSLAENRDGRTTAVYVGNATATDQDNDTLTYSITEGDTNKFNIDSSVGEITYIGSGENYESGNTQHNLTVQASDRTNDITAKVIINIKNINESIAFNQSFYTFYLNENADGSTNPITIGKVNAISGSGIPAYSFLDNTYSRKFNNITNDGDINYIGNGEDYNNEENQFNLTVGARIDGNSTSVNITVNIVNSNDTEIIPLQYNVKTDEKETNSNETGNLLPSPNVNTDENESISPPSSTSDKPKSGSGSGDSGRSKKSKPTPEEEEEEEYEYEFKTTSSSADTIKITSNKIAKNIKVSANRIRNTSSTIQNIPTPQGKVYEYIEITTSGLEDDEIVGATIEFSVSIEWLSENGFEKEDVVLLRYNEDKNEWEEFNTIIISENSTEVRYSADTSMFSIFSITAKNEETPTTTSIPQTDSSIEKENKLKPLAHEEETHQQETNTVPNDIETNIPQTPAQTQPIQEESSSTTLIFIILGIIIIITGIIIYISTRKTEE